MLMENCAIFSLFLTLKPDFGWDRAEYNKQNRYKQWLSIPPVLLMGFGSMPQWIRVSMYCRLAEQGAKLAVLLKTIVLMSEINI